MHRTPDAAMPAHRTRPLVALVAALTTAAALLSGPLAAPAAAVGEVSDTINIRLPQGMNDPMRLALRFSRTTFPDESVQRVILATAGTFADALASGTLQGVTSPLLLTPSDDLRADVGEEIERLGATTVTLLGGTQALSTDVAEELEDAGLDVERISGSTRIHTAVAIAEQVPEATTAILSRAGAGTDLSQGFADALAAGSWAAENFWPTLLTGAEGLPEATRDHIADSNIDTVFVLGGTAAISDTVLGELAELGVDAIRVAGPNRAATAVEVARMRGYDDAGDAEGIVLVEGQASDAWAAGFAAAATSARRDAPVLLANGPSLPPETREFLESGDFDVDDIDGAVLVCAADPLACDEARLALGLPREAAITVEEPADGVPSRSDLTGVIDLFGAQATVAVFGACVEGGLVQVADDGRVAIPIEGPPGACALEFEVTFAGGTVQTVFVPIVVASAIPQTGVVVNTETGGDAYTFVPTDADAARTVTYTDADAFFVNGESATVGAFEAALTVGDTITHQPDTTDGDIHQLADADPSSLRSGTVGDVDLQAGTLAIIEPVTGTALRPGIDIADFTGFRVDGTETDRAALEANINEGDAIALDGRLLAIVNDQVTGPATRIQVDRVSGVLRVGIGELGDDPFNAEDDRIRVVAGREDQQTLVDGSAVSFDAFAEALTPGDTLTYDRVGGIEVISLSNGPTPSVVGLVTEAFDPDGSPVAPEPEDGGALVLLAPQGRQEVTYAETATFRVDGQLSTEAELEAARTPGDRVTYQPADPGTDTPEEVTLVNRDLAGDIADITEGADSVDVLTPAGVLYDDLDYTAAIFGGEATYFDGDDEVDLATFERLLGAIDAGEQDATILVRPGGDGTQHRLTFADD